MRVWTLLILSLLPASEVLKAQSTYFDMRELVMEASMEQPLAHNFKSEFPELFENDNCPPSFRREKPVPGDFELEIEPTDEQTRNAVNILLRNDCDRFIILDALGDFYFPQLSNELTDRDLSQEYKYLPLVLSGLNPLFDNGYGKIGAWQMDFITARKFGLLVNQKVDERKDFNRSSDAALNFLSLLKDQYPDSPGKIILAFCRSPLYVQKTYGQDEISVENLSEEDAQLLTFFTTARGLFEGMETGNHRLQVQSLLKNRKATPFNYSLSFESIAKVLEADQNEIALMNPVFINHQLDSTYRKVPFVLEKKQSLAFEALEDSIFIYEKRILEKEVAERKAEEERIRNNIPDPKTSKEIIYKVRSGDVLGKIAERYGLRVSDIRVWNDIRGNMIYVGQELVLYVPNSKVTSEEKTVVEKQKENGYPSREEEVAPKGEYITYTVKSGDNLWLIAKNYPGVSAENIMQWNDIQDDIKPGLKLKIYLTE